MRDDRPCGQPQRRVGARIPIDQRLRGRASGRELLHRVEILRRGAQHDRGMLVLGERFGEPERAVDGRVFHRRHLVVSRRLQLLAVRKDGGVTRRGSPLVQRIVVGRALVLARRLAVVVILEKQVGELIVDVGRLGIGGERR